MNHTARFAVLATVLFAGAAVFAADADRKVKTVTLKDGKVLEDAYVLDKKPNGATIAYKDGCMFIKFSDMPLEIQQKFGYDPIKSARYEKKQDEQKRLREIEQAEEKAREKKRKADEDRHYKDRRISQQQQKVRKLELELEEAQKKLDSAEKTVGEDRAALVSTLGSQQVSIDNPWGIGRTTTSTRNSAVRNKLMKESDALSAKRDNLAQDVIDLRLKLEAAQKTLDAMLQNGK